MKKIKRLILHIGTQKAGSTSIQRSLGTSRKTLLEHNIYYPAIKPYNHIISFLPIFMDDPVNSLVFQRKLKSYEDKDLKVKAYRKSWLKEFKTCNKENFVISAEHFTIPSFKVDFVARLKEFVEEYFEQATLIAYVRHYDKLIPSHVQQIIKNGLDEKSIKEILDDALNCPPILSYQKSLEKWIKVFGRENLVVRPFDPQAFYRGSLLADFFHACDLPAEDILIPEIRSNESMGKNAIAFLQAYNKAYPVFINGSINLERGLAWQRIPVELYNDLPDEKFKFEIIYSPKQAHRLNQEIDFVNQFFTDGYQFPHVSSGTGEMVFPTSDDIPVEFFVELINNYNKRIESLNRQNDANLEKKTFHRQRNKKLRWKNRGE